MKQLVLASASPRRIEIMRNKGYDPVIMPADIDESIPFPMTPESYVMYLALKKACRVSDDIGSRYDGCVIVGADTAVVFRGRVIGKPHSKEEAFSVLSDLRNECHHVVTGVCVITTEKSASDDENAFSSKKCLYEDTAVFFKDYSDEMLTRYVNTSEPYDKAGGYAMQGTFKEYIDHIEGDPDNVIGFPWTAAAPFLKL